MGVEYVFTGGHGLREQFKNIGNNLDGRKDLQAADPHIDERSGKYRRIVAVQT